MSDAGTPPAAPEAPQFSEHDLAMIEKGREGLSDIPVPHLTPAVPDAPVRPDHVPEKFWKDGKVDADGLARSYAELEKKLGAAPVAAETPPAAEGEPPVAADGKIVPPAAEEAPAASPVATLIEAAAVEYGSDGAFSEDTTKALVEAGIPAEIQQVYLAGLEAMRDKSVGEIHSYVGGEDTYKAMATWAAQTLNDAELGAFNEALDNPQMRENAVRGLYARFTTARPSEGTLVAPNGGLTSDGDVFASRDELVLAQKDPRYTTDPTYRRDVEAKLLRSQRGGFSVAERRLFSGNYTRGK